MTANECDSRVAVVYGCFSGVDSIKRLLLVTFEAIYKTTYTCYFP